MATGGASDDKVESMRGFVLCVLLSASVFAQTKPQPEPKYEMTTYIVGFLSKGPKWTPEVTEETKAIQAGHMENIRKMAATGKLTVAGPFADGGDLRGMFIFSGTTVDEVKAMVAEDPAVKAGRLVLDVKPWMAAKGIKIDPPK